MLILDPNKYEIVTKLDGGIGQSPNNPLPCLVLTINKKPYIFPVEAGKDIISFVTQILGTLDVEFLKHQFIKVNDNWIYIDDKGKRWNCTKTGQDTLPILLVEE